MLHSFRQQSLASRLSILVSKNNLAVLVPMPGRFSLSGGHEIVEQQERIRHDREIVRPGKAPV